MKDLRRKALALKQAVADQELENRLLKKAGDFCSQQTNCSFVAPVRMHLALALRRPEEFRKIIV